MRNLYRILKYDRGLNSGNHRIGPRYSFPLGLVRRSWTISLAVSRRLRTKTLKIYQERIGIVKSNTIKPLNLDQIRFISNHKWNKQIIQLVTNRTLADQWLKTLIMIMIVNSRR